jgi:glycosyltransferase involved in cell wall biosynthesis
MNGIALAYSGVHQIFQLALAAYELGELNGLFCSIVDGPGRWGGWLGKLAPPATVRPLGWEGLPQSCITENPWPLLANRLGKRVLKKRRSNHVHSNHWFDKSAARWLEGREVKIFVGAETCALECFRMAEKRGIRRVLDCPGVPTQVLEREASLAASEFGIRWTPGPNMDLMVSRKAEELELADIVLCCSEFQRRRLLECFPFVKRSEVISLWTDVPFWSAVAARRPHAENNRPLRVLCAGAVSLKKGIPYLLQAVEPLEREVELTLVGSVAAEMPPVLKRFRPHRHLPYMSKDKLASLYLEHDVLVMPTLGDSFGFVTVEAMASGMPVIASRNAGAPVPDESWRVPPRDAEAIRARLLAYHADRELLRHHGEVAATFGQGFRPVDYRRRAGKLFQELLAA